jgi:flavodoxin I
VKSGGHIVRIIIVYASMTGNTEEMAECVAAGIREAGWDPTVEDVMDVDASKLEAYDGLLLGAYTWGDGGLPDEFLDFYDDMEDLQLNGKKAAVFGSCDSSYEKIGAAVDILIDKVRQLGAEVAMEGLKIELTLSDEDKDKCKQFGKQFVQHLT